MRQSFFTFLSTATAGDTSRAGNFTLSRRTGFSRMRAKENLNGRTANAVPSAAGISLWRMSRRLLGTLAPRARLPHRARDVSARLLRLWVTGSLRSRAVETARARSTPLRGAPHGREVKGEVKAFAAAQCPSRCSVLFVGRSARHLLYTTGELSRIKHLRPAHACTTLILR